MASAVDRIESAVITGLHHIGVVVRDIAEAAPGYERKFGYAPRTPIIHDPVQTAFVQFFTRPGDRVYLELVAPDGEHSKLANALGKGGGLNHLCYATDDIDGDCRALRSQQMLQLAVPVAAAAFPGRRIAWMMGADRMPIELVEQGGPDDL